MCHGSGAVREQQLLWDVLMHVDIGGLRTEQLRVVLLAYGDDDVQRFVAEAVEERGKTSRLWL